MTSRIIIIAGPNGAGKTTFAREFLPKEAGCPAFVNADLIAAGLSPFAPEAVAFQAGRLMLETVAQHVARRNSFAVETTLSGLGYARQIPRWRAAGYGVELHFLSLPCADMAVRRVAERVRHGGHDIPEATIRRRYDAGLQLLNRVYKHLVDEWILYDNSGLTPLVLDWSLNMNDESKVVREPGTDDGPRGGDLRYANRRVRDALAAMRRAAQCARKVAHESGTMLVLHRDGKIVLVPPTNASDADTPLTHR
jgi:predicted ABC-type ATPase